MKTSWLGGSLWLFATLGFFTALPAADEKERGIGDFPKLSAERDWPWWRGPSRNGIAATTSDAPVKFGESESVVWRTSVPGRGHSSPIIVGDRVFLTAADESSKTQSVLAFNRTDGRLLGKIDVSQGGFPARIHEKNTHATPTIASDGERLFVTFFHHDTIQATAFTLAGKQVWQKTVGPFRPRTYEYGYAPSPLLYRDTVIIAGEYDGDSFIAALNRTTGEQVWRTKRPKNITFSSPVVGHVAGRDQLLISGANQVASYHPGTGVELWTTPGTTAATCGTMIWDGDIVFASGGYPKSETLAVRADGSGKVLWRNPQKCYEQSLLTHGGYVYGLTDGGILYCWHGADGQEMWKERLKGPVSSSPVLAGGLIYWANEFGTHYVFKPNPKQFEPVAENRVGDEGFANPAVCGGQLFLRAATTVKGKREEFLYCFGK